MARARYPRRIVIVGAGVSGLSAAYTLSTEHPELEVSIVERADRAGGLIQTEAIDGCLVEQGPDSLITDKPWGVELARELGLGEEIIDTNADKRGAYIVTRGRLERIPLGFSMMSTSDLPALIKSPILSWRGKLRFALEPLMPRGPDIDESVASFVARRCGREVLERLAQPLMSGIYGSDPASLSLQATMPRFQQWEQQHGSVYRGLRRSLGQHNQAATGARYGMFVSFARGMQTLTDALAARLTQRLRLSSTVRKIVPSPGPAPHGYKLELSSGEVIDTDALILTTSAYVAAELLADVDSNLASLLGELRYESSATVSYAWPKTALPRPLDAFGFIVPKVENRQILASTWASVKYAGRAPADRELIRVFFGGAAQRALLEREDAELIRAGREELRQLLGVQAPPDFASLRRQMAAMPQYSVGHRDWLARVRERQAKITGLFLAGNAYEGVGIPDAVRSGREAARQLAATAAPRQRAAS